jgi:hypothetical protein
MKQSPVTESTHLIERLLNPRTIEADDDQAEQDPGQSGWKGKVGHLDARIGRREPE